MSVKSTPTTPVGKSLNQTSGVTANQVYTPVVCNEASGSESALKRYLSDSKLTTGPTY